MKMLSRFAAISTLVLGVLAGPSFASAQTTVDIIGGKVLAKGAGVLVTLEVTCEVLDPPAIYTSASVNIVQRSGNKFATGWGYSEGLACSTTPQTAEVLVRTDAFVRFKAGDAIADANINQYNIEDEWTSGNARSVIRLSN